MSVSTPELSNGTSSQSGALRDELVDTAVKFLQNPKVINSPLAQKQKFLEKRGLTDDEIRMACERSGAYDHHEQILKSSQTLPNHNNMMMTTSHGGYGPMQMSWFDRVREILHSVAVFSIVVYVIKRFYDMYIAPFLFGMKKKSIEEKLDDLEKNVDESMQDLKTGLTDVKSQVDRLSFESENEFVSELKDLRSEVSTIKGLLLTRKQFPSVSNSVVPPSIPAWQMSSVHQENQSEGDKEELLEVGSGSGSSEPEHGMKTSESSLEIIYSKDYDSESCHSKKSSREGNVTD